MATDENHSLWLQARKQLSGVGGNSQATDALANTLSAYPALHAHTCSLNSAIQTLQHDYKASLQVWPGTVAVQSHHTNIPCERTLSHSILMNSAAHPGLKGTT